jgi:hypothetical protein
MLSLREMEDEVRHCEDKPANQCDLSQMPFEQNCCGDQQHAKGKIRCAIVPNQMFVVGT